MDHYGWKSTRNNFFSFEQVVPLCITCKLRFTVPFDTHTKLLLSTKYS